MADGEEPETSVEQPEASPVPAEPSEQVAAEPVPSETPAETAAEEPTEPDAELQKQLDSIDRFVAAEFAPKEAAEAAPTEDEKITLTKKELEAREFQARQSAADRATREAEERLAERDQQLRLRAAMEQQMRTRIHERAKGILDAGGELPPDFGDAIAAEYRDTYYGEGYTVASQRFAQAALKSLNALDGAKDAPDDVMQPLHRQAKSEEDVFDALLEVAHALGRRSLEEEFEKRVEAEANKRAQVKTAVTMKKWLKEQRAAQEPAQLPEGVGASAGELTVAQYAAMSPEEKRNLPKEKIDAMTRRAMGMA
jgi:hypothetical protein